MTEVDNKNCGKIFSLSHREASKPIEVTSIIFYMKSTYSTLSGLGYLHITDESYPLYSEKNKIMLNLTKIL